MTLLHLPGLAPTPPRLSGAGRSARGLCAFADCETSAEDHVRNGARGWLWMCSRHAEMWRRQP